MPFHAMYAFDDGDMICADSHFLALSGRRWRHASRLSARHAAFRYFSAAAPSARLMMAEIFLGISYFLFSLGKLPVSLRRQDKKRYIAFQRQICSRRARFRFSMPLTCRRRLSPACYLTYETAARRAILGADYEAFACRFRRIIRRWTTSR